MSLELPQSKSVTCQLESIENLLEYAKNNRADFNDVTINGPTVKIAANRMVLCCYSPYFQQRLKQHSRLDIHSPDINGEVLSLLIEFMYTGKITFDYYNVFEVLQGADLLELNEVKQFCFEFLEQCITPANCFTILIKIENFHHLSLRLKIYKCISNSFYEAVGTKAFKSISYDVIFACIFQMKTEFHAIDNELIKSIQTWVEHDEENRKQCVSPLIKMVNVDRLSFCCVHKFLAQSLCQENPESLKLFEKRLNTIKSSETAILSTSSNKKLKVVYKLNDKIKLTYPKLPEKLSSQCLVKLNYFVYCIGTQKLCNTRAFELNTTEKELMWKEIAKMKSEKYDMDCVVFNEVLVVTGGRNKNEVFSTSEAYDTKLERWDFIRSMLQCRSGNKLVVSGRYLFSLGGHDGENVLSTVERLDGLKEAWKSVSPMQKARNKFAAVSCNETIYVIGV